MIKRIILTLSILAAISPFVYADVPPIFGNGGSGASPTATDDANGFGAVPPVMSTGTEQSSQRFPQVVNFNKNQTANNESNLIMPRRVRRFDPTVDLFEQSVYVRTGLHLRRYGYDFFLDPNTFIPGNNIPASSNYVLGPGDKILIRGWGAVNINIEDTIDKNGGIVIPNVGRISLLGVRVANLDTYLTNKISKFYRNFKVSATITQLRSIQIVVAGFALNPGAYTVSSLSTLTDAIFASGGPSNAGSLRQIQLKRGGVVIANYDMYDLLLNGNNTADVRLAPGDVIYICPHGKQAAIYEGVKSPGIYEMKDGETVADLLRFAGGTAFNNNKQKLIIEKMDENKAIKVLTYSYIDGLSKTITDGDIVHFFSMVNRYSDSVVLAGQVANPTRLAWYKGITVRDVIPNKKDLLTKNFWNTYSDVSYARNNQKSNLNEKNNTLLSENFPINNMGGLGMSSSDRGMSSSDRGMGGTPSSGELSGSTKSESMSKSTEDAVKDNFVSGSNLFVAGPVAIPEANINWGYAVIIRINKDNFASELIPFDLGLALQGDPKNNLLLQPGDIINVLSSKDIIGPSRTDKLYVMVDGEVNQPGVFELKPGSKLLDAISSAHGITKDAYLYGLMISRDAVKKQQKAALNQMLDSAQQSLLAQAANATAQSGGNSSSGASTIMSQQQELLDKMRELKPTGRVILGLTSDKITLSSLPNIKLENGDVIHIPPVPSTVSVIGQVYNAGTYMFNKNRSVGDYIDMAGTPNDFADNSNIYILHADGTLYNKQQAGWFGTFASRSVYPGDSIVVPQNVQFMPFQQQLLNWTTILANFGMAAAAVQVFHQ